MDAKEKEKRDRVAALTNRVKASDKKQKQEMNKIVGKYLEACKNGEPINLNGF